jgi:hypothetical protein
MSQCDILGNHIWERRLEPFFVDRLRSTHLGFSICCGDNRLPTRPAETVRVPCRPPSPPYCLRGELCGVPLPERMEARRRATTRTVSARSLGSRGVYGFAVAARRGTVSGLIPFFPPGAGNCLPSRGNPLLQLCRSLGLLADQGPLLHLTARNHGCCG